MKKEDIQRLLLRCQSSPIFFIENFCKIKHPTAGILPFNLFSYQKTSLNKFKKCRFNLYKKVRQCGVSTLAGAYALWFILFHSHKTVLIVSKRDNDATGFLEKNVKFVYDHLPDLFKEIYGDPPVVYNEHTIVLPNGSRMQSLTSSKDTLRSNSSSLNILDEVGFMPHMDDMWAAGSPTLIHGGSVIAISTCLIGDTLISTNIGMKTIKEICDNKENLLIETPENGFKQITNWFVYHNKPIKKIETSNGYKLSGTYDHRIKTFDGYKLAWKRLDEISVGDDIPLFPTNSNAKKHIEPDLAYLMGLILAEGYINNNYVVVTNGDDDIINWLLSKPCGLNFKIDGKDGFHYRVCNRKFVRLLKDFGFVIGKGIRAHNKLIPQSLYECTNESIAAFICGYADGDGHSRKDDINRTRGGEVGFSSTSYELLEQIRYILLNFGIICRKLEVKPEYDRMFPGDKLRHCREAYQLIIESEYVSRYYDAIGFRLSRKMSNQKAMQKARKLPIRNLCYRLYQSGLVSQSILKKKYNIRTCNVFFGKRKKYLDIKTANKFLKINEYKYLDDYKVLNEIISMPCDWSMIKKVENDGLKDVYDMTIDKAHTYIANGFYSHNCNGQGNWYNITWEDAVNGNNQFNPIEIQWWEMDWTIEYRDSITNKMCKIAPRDGIRECTTKEEIDKWGKYWSPWLEDQYRQLQKRGEAHLFRQEILAEFIGSGDTVLSRTTLIHIKETINHNFGIVEMVDNYAHPITGEKFTINFENELRIWEKPVRATPPTIENGRIIKPGTSGHVYTMGVDIASGQAEDYSAIVIIDCNILEQVAELNMKISPSVLVMMVDYLARWYNTALVVPERTGIGDPVTQAIYEDIAYPNVYRMRINNKLAKRVGYPTTPAHKPALVKCLMDCLGEDGVTIKSSRLFQQLSIFINLGKNKVGNVKGPGNHDDLVIACALALIGLRDAVQSDHRMLIPSRFSPTDEQMPMINNEVMSQGGIRAVPPIIMSSDLVNTMTPEQEIANFTRSLGATINHPGNVPAVIHRKRMGPDGRIIG